MELIVTTKEDLKNIFREVVEERLLQKETSPKVLYIEDAVGYLTERGFRATKSQLYKLTSTRAIPFAYINKRLVFDPQILNNWVKLKLQKGRK